LDRDYNADEQSQPGFTSKVVWIPPAVGLLASIVTSVIGATTKWEYRHEGSMAVFFVVSSLVAGYYNGRLRTHSGATIGLALIFGAIGAALMHW
jgi:hypothetical protein